jgi:hypothetical protein
MTRIPINSLKSHISKFIKNTKIIKLLLSLDPNPVKFNNTNTRNFLPSALVTTLYWTLITLKFKLPASHQNIYKQKNSFVVVHSGHSHTSAGRNLQTELTFQQNSRKFDKSKLTKFRTQKSVFVDSVDFVEMLYTRVDIECIA